MRLGRLTALVGFGYFPVWTAFGMAVRYRFAALTAILLVIGGYGLARDGCGRGQPSPPNVWRRELSAWREASEPWGQRSF